LLVRSRKEEQSAGSPPLDLTGPAAVDVAQEKGEGEEEGDWWGPQRVEWSFHMSV
jgi:hypothetical protein